MSSKDLRVTLSGVTLDNPVIPASGTYGFGQEFTPYYDINILGSLSFKGTTAESRFGNPTPRIAECPNGMLNSVGLQNPGVEHVIAHELPALRKIFHKPIIANISGFSVEEYVHCVELLTRKSRLKFSKSTSPARTCGTAAWRSVRTPTRRRKSPAPSSKWRRSLST